MLSGNGRHRRPRQAPALLVAAGVTGSAIAIPLLGASGASAADGTTWDRVADCETGGAWSQNSGNGYFGGLQLSQEDWENHGGLDYAPSADLASRTQQIAVAERILADQGVGAWRTCGLLSGLEQDKKSSDSSESSDSSGLLDSLGSSPSSSASPSPDAPSTSKDGSATSDKSPDSEDSASQDQEPDSSPSASPERDRSDNSRQDDDSSALTETGTDTGSGRHRGPGADETRTPENGRTDESTGRHASRGEEGSRDASEGAYIVGIGDSLWSIADSLDISGGWHELYDGNKKAVGTDPNLIRPGQTLTVEGEAGEK
ncbi:peptidoglycan-binding protein LysM [Streptomyces violarus]|uniref:Nucleoid-associated protein YgaU n=1 Tax=Streptomyces violarus TaxID=67380 RepID=A0A7W5F4Z6_9ACTN|nr:MULTISPECIES: transglycosylase family protein [Streptomyces]MBB3080310.1 nucleoid-associated protein YgaU [Streptomyces violarus]WRU00743.1 transglycosylase family protein [Streptomyces sp. CGMCC 4.1772]GHD15037.1 peptidoglycan-binding protein LysM [Streptomyces violarus]